MSEEDELAHLSVHAPHPRLAQILLLLRLVAFAGGRSQQPMYSNIRSSGLRAHGVCGLVDA